MGRLTGMGKKKPYPLTREWRFGKAGTPKQQQDPTPAPKKKRDRPHTVPSNVRICDHCGQKTFYNVTTDENEPHQWASNGRWCKGGGEPSRKARKARGRQSVRAMSAGLPGLGKRT